MKAIQKASWWAGIVLLLAFAGTAGATSGAVVGTSSGTFSVSSQGAATYHMPLSLPPGVGRMTPSLSANYSSQGADQYMGPGWSISGFSQIARCPRTYAQNGVVQGINPALAEPNGDRFCLDGQQLVTTNASTYGAVGMPYRTEVESFNLVTSVGGSSGNPASFTVQTRSGLTLTYGNGGSANVKNGGSGPTYIWLLNSSTDLEGNSIQYTWQNLGGEYLPLSITYGGGAAITVRFTFVARQGYKPMDYLGGLAVPHAYRLQQIDTVSGSTPIRHWVFGYVVSSDARTTDPTPPSIPDPMNPPLPGGGVTNMYQGQAATNAAPATLSVGRDIVTSVTECTGSDGTPTCANPTQFTWNGALGSYADETAPNGGLGETGTPFVGDFDGDGFSDVINLYFTPAGGLNVVTSWAGGLGTASSLQNLYPASNATNVYFGRSPFGVGDCNGDGKTDLVASYELYSNNAWVSAVEVLPGSANGFQHQNLIATGAASVGGGAPLVGDFNGDGLADALLYLAAPTSINFQLFSSTVPTRGAPTGMLTAGTVFTLSQPSAAYWTPVAVDVNGDGATDLVLTHNDSSGVIIQTYLNPGNGQFLTSPTYSATVLSGNFVTNPSLFTTVTLQFADVNGDGSPDFIVTNENSSAQTATIYTALSWANGTFGPASSTSISLTNTDVGTVVTGDFNGDGMADVALVDYGTTPDVVLALSEGNGQFAIGSAGTLSTAFPGENVNLAGDFNGDGISDIGSFGTGAVITTLQGAPYLRIKGIDDGFGSPIGIVYSQLTNPTVYQDSGGGETFPMVPVHAARYVAYQTQQDNPGGPNGGVRQETYQYWDARYNAQGRGFLGYARVDATDTTGNGATPIDRRATYRQDFPFIGLMSGTENYDVTSPTTPLEISWTGTWFTSTPTSSGSTFAYSNASDSQWLETSSGSAVPTRSTFVTDSYDATTGDLLTHNQTVSTGNFASRPQYSTSVTNTYHDITSGGAWLLGLLTDSQVTASDTTGTRALTREMSATYDQTNGHMLTRTVEPGSSTLQSTFTYGYDGFGNPNSATLAGAGFTTRTVSATYASVAPYYGRFQTQSCNSLAQPSLPQPQPCVNRSYDPTTGNLTATTDANGLTVHYQYNDPMGRYTGASLLVGSSLNVSSTLSRNLCASSPSNCTSTAVTTNGFFYEEATDSAGDDAITVYDRAERVVRQAAINGGGNWIEVLTQYDAAGRPYRTSSPRFAGSSAADTFWTTGIYDDQNRTSSVTAPTDQTHPTGSVTSYGYNGLTTTVTNPRGYPTTTTVDGRGLPVAVTDAANSTLGYSYDAFGNLKTVTDPNGNLTTMTYDLLGHKLSQADPDMGSWSYSFDAIGELQTQKDAKNQILSYSYDLLGRITSRSDPVTYRSWTWDTTWIGALAAESTSPLNSSTVATRRTFGYTPFGAANSDTQLIDGNSYQTTTQYDTQGRVAQVNQPGGFAVARHYNSHGAQDLLYPPNAVGASNCATGASGCPFYWQAASWDNWNGIALENLGNSASTDTTRDPAVGLVSSIDTGEGGYTAMQALSYTWDANGNLTARIDADQGGQSETFVYDTLDRLQSDTVTHPATGMATMNLAYDALGNITSKTGQGGYSYTGKPHQVSSVGGTAYSYDANGNITGTAAGSGPGAGRSYSWDVDNYPTSLTANGVSRGFEYDTDHGRIAQTVSSGSIQYLADGLTEVQSTGVTQSYLVAPTGVIGVNAASGGSNAVTYFHRDALGSIVETSSQGGTPQERLNYDAFGQRTVTPGPNIDSEIGYTGQLQLDALNLVHMNGRVYDPALGRFISADPLIQAPGNLQSFNRYSYTWNGPLSATDPSGFDDVANTTPFCNDSPGCDVGYALDGGAGSVGQLDLYGPDSLPDLVDSGSSSSSSNSPYSAMASLSTPQASMTQYSISASGSWAGVVTMTGASSSPKSGDGGFGPSSTGIITGNSVAANDTLSKLVALNSVQGHGGTNSSGIAQGGNGTVGASSGSLAPSGGSSWYESNIGGPLRSSNFGDLIEKIVQPIPEEGALEAGIATLGTQLGNTAAKTAGQLGREGEDAVRRFYDIGEKIGINVNGRNRIPDGLRPGEVLSEVKNVNSLSLTRQLRDYMEYSQSEGLAFQLFTRPNSQLSGPLQGAIEDGFIIRLDIPQ